jgi:hypothetical protein
VICFFKGIFLLPGNEREVKFMQKLDSKRTLPGRALAALLAISLLAAGGQTALAAEIVSPQEIVLYEGQLW